MAIVRKALAKRIGSVKDLYIPRLEAEHQRTLDSLHADVRDALTMYGIAHPHDLAQTVNYFLNHPQKIQGESVAPFELEILLHAHHLDDADRMIRLGIHIEDARARDENPPLTFTTRYEHAADRLFNFGSVRAL